MNRISSVPPLSFPPPNSEAKQAGSASHACLYPHQDLHLGNAAHTNHVGHPPIHAIVPYCIIDRRSQEHICPHQHVFYSFRRENKQVTLSTGITLDSIGVGNIICKIQDKLLWITNVLCIPSLHHFVYSIPTHRRQRSCSYASTIVGNFITFPNFSIAAGRTTRIPITHCVHLPQDSYDFIYDEIFVDISSDEDAVVPYNVTGDIIDTTAPPLSENDDNSTVSLSDLSFSDILGFALHTFENKYCQQHTCIVDSGASSHMCPIREAFVTYLITPNSYVTVTNNKKISCLGRGNIILYLDDKLV